MSKILVINGGQEFAHSKGSLNKHLTNICQEFLQENQQEVLVSHVDSEYNISDEIQKYLWADIIIYQMPAWWMSTPWKLKKYIDEIFTEGYHQFCSDDGRTAENPNINYGTGGFLQKTKYMLSITWNAPLNAFTDKNELFEGKGVDTVYFHFHKAHQYMGMKPLTTFMFNDVIKNPTIDDDIIKYKQHLQEHVINISH